MTNQIFEDMNAIQMEIWGEVAPTGEIGLKVVSKEGVTFRIPVVIDDKPNVENVESHAVNNPIKLASFMVSAWRAHVRTPQGKFRDPCQEDIMTTLDGKTWEMDSTSPTTDGRYICMLFRTTGAV